MRKIKTLLVDDHQIVRDGIRAMLLPAKDEIEIAAEASNGAEAVQILEKEPFDVVLMDINMPELNGIDATEIIKKRHPATRVLALTMHAEEGFIVNMIKAGADGYILKESGREELISAIKAVRSGKKYYSNEVSVTMINSMLSDKPSASKIVGDLSKREMEVLQLIVDGFTNMEIADKLFISNRTVDTHRRNLLQKLNVRNTAELVKFALKNGLVE
ncbi:MAG TPA: DNA-binding response regulator [Flavobacteriales bacterium]|nr:DNA-binding response regulator [Flavobacteriales bacterium]|tara:strand:+ start:46164 stop:46811 length:648 start_codon:yes stop_codon:yes gene_type:complete